MLRLADGPDELVMAPEVALECARNAGFPVIRLTIPGLEDALANGAAELSENLETG